MAGAEPNKVGWTAFRLAIAGFIIPFFFIYSPEMLLIADNGWQIVWASVTAIAGIALLAVAAEGYFTVVLPLWSRALFLAGSLMLISPGVLGDFIGLGIAVLAWLSTFVVKRFAPEPVEA
jgi:TRAP-type uncharacterized transport system fused permease subunit